MNAPNVGENASAHRAYRPLLELGRGGTARVYLAESLSSGIRKLVVLKILNPELCADAEMRASFRREAELSAQMNHPNVVQVMEVVEHLETPVIVMEYLDGLSLSALRRQAGSRLPLRLHMHVFAEALAGLHHFHELKDLDGTPLNAVHRDVSPQNVMVLYDGPVKVLDFGVAKINAPADQVTRTGTIKGKIHYMPPEQLLGEAGIDRRADVFAVGVMLWEAVAGRRMWEGQSEAEFLRNLVTGTLPRLRDVARNAPQSVVEIVECATEFDRVNRFATAREMQVAIEQALEEQGGGVQPRELAEFMSGHFGESRRAQEQTIKSALRAPMSSDVMDCAPPSGPPSGARPSGESRSPTPRAATLVVSRVPWTGKRNWSWAFGALFCVALVGTWTLMRHRTSRGQAMSAPVTMITLEVEVLPPGSEILLDGTPLGRDRYLGQRPRSDRAVVLEVRAPGYLSERKEITLRNDMAVKMMLEPDPATARSSVSSAGVPTTETRSRARPPEIARTPPKSPGPPPGNVSGKCNPPYTFSADGVKTYKPECF